MIRELHEKLRQGEVTALGLAEKHFASIEEKNGSLGAYLTLSKERALRQAEAVDRRLARKEPCGLLAGIPGAVKDNICMRGVRTTAASKVLDNYIAPYDATVIERLEEAGAVLLGKTNLDEFAMGSSTELSAYGRTQNPLDPERVPGGSSGGSAAAVAADMAVFALGSDTGGSIRQPAAFCGIIGLKPTYGRVSRSGLIAMASSFDQIGPLCRSVEDAAIVLSAIAGEDGRDATSAASGNGKPFEEYLSGDIRGLRIGIPREYFSEDMDADIRQCSLDALERFKSLGAEVKEVSFPHSRFVLPVYYTIVYSETSSNLARFDGIRYGLRVNDAGGKLLETYLDTRSMGFGPEVKRRTMLGTYALSAGYYDAYYLQAQKVRALIRQDFERAFHDVDLVFSPTAPESAFAFGEKTDDPLKMYLSDIYTVTANLAGVPALSFPIGTKAGLPVGGQLMGRWFDEETVLCAGDAFERQQALS